MKRVAHIAIVVLVLAGTSTAPAQKFYSPDVTAIIDKYGCAGCHGGSGGLDVTPYSSIMSTGLHGPVVVANDSNSIIVKKLKGTAAFGARMPFGGPYLSEDEIAVVVQWIMNGAKELPATADVAETGIPLRLELAQNYPNPFNPSTTVAFELPATSSVRLVVYDMLGRQVAVLLNEVRTAGQHRITFNAAGLASGTYTYRLTAGDQILTKRMLLVR
jgi:hypothetical protein